MKPEKMEKAIIRNIAGDRAFMRVLAQQLSMGVMSSRYGEPRGGLQGSVSGVNPRSARLAISVPASARTE